MPNAEFVQAEISISSAFVTDDSRAGQNARSEAFLRGRLLNTLWQLRIGRPLHVEGVDDGYVVIFANPLTPYCIAEIQRSALRLLDWSVWDGRGVIALELPAEWGGTLGDSGGFIWRDALEPVEVEWSGDAVCVHLFDSLDLGFPAAVNEFAVLRQQMRDQRTRYARLLNRRRAQVSRLRIELVQAQARQQDLQIALRGALVWFGKTPTTHEERQQMEDARWRIIEALQEGNLF